jgi:hypothetical protein
MWLQNIYPASDTEKLLAMLAGFFMWSISLAPQFWRDEQKVYHPLFTYIAIVLGLAWVTIHLYPVWYWWAPTVVLLVGAYFLRKVENSTLWTEYMAAVVIFTPTL